MLKFLFLLIALFALLQAQPPLPPRGPYENTLDLAPYLWSLGNAPLSDYFGAPPYYQLYWNVTSTHVKIAVVCRLIYPPGDNSPSGINANMSNFCGFGFTSSPGYMIPNTPGDANDAIIGHTLDYVNVAVQDFRLQARLISPTECFANSSSSTPGVCPDVAWTWTNGSTCADNVQSPVGFFYNASASEGYMAYAFSRLLDTYDRDTCDFVIPLGQPMNPIFSIGFAHKPGSWPWNVGAPNFYSFVHAARGPSNISLTITFGQAPETTTGLSTTAQSSTGQSSTGQSSTGQSSAGSTTSSAVNDGVIILMNKYFVFITFVFTILILNKN